MGEHTPGPWKIKRSTYEYYVCDSEDKIVMTPNVCFTGHEKSKNARANMALIAQAPEMAATIKRLEERVKELEEIGRNIIEEGYVDRADFEILKQVLEGK
jgi:hypothetical protein